MADKEKPRNPTEFGKALRQAEIDYHKIRVEWYDFLEGVTPDEVEDSKKAFIKAYREHRNFE